MKRKREDWWSVWTAWSLLTDKRLIVSDGEVGLTERVARYSGSQIKDPIQ